MPVHNDVRLTGNYSGFFFYAQRNIFNRGENISFDDFRPMANNADRYVCAITCQQVMVPEPLVRNRLACCIDMVISCGIESWRIHESFC